MNAIASIIRAHHGQYYESAGAVFGFFPDPDEALTAMSLLTSQGYDVSRCGSQITIEM